MMMLNKDTQSKDANARLSGVLAIGRFKIRRTKIGAMRLAERRRNTVLTGRGPQHGCRGVGILRLVLVVMLSLESFGDSGVLALQSNKPQEFDRRPRIRRAVSKITRPIRSKLWPNTLPDLSYTEPLPPGPLGCPFRGFNIKESSPEFGPGTLFFRLFEKLKRPTVYKFFSQNQGFAIVSGYSAAKAVVSQEFDAVASQFVSFTSKVVGTHSLRCAQDKREHAALRRLIGMAVQPTSVSNLIPSIQKTAESLIETVLQNGATSTQKSPIIDVEGLSLKYTLEIACRHIIGLQDLPAEEVDYFLLQVKTWIAALYVGPDDHAWKSARDYLVGKIDDKLAWLEANGPDESTVSGMLFAQDPDDPTARKLSRDEIIDNTLLLILAGSETSAGTLTNSLLLLALNRKVQSQTNFDGATTSSAWNQLVREQERIQELKDGSSQLDRAMLDECTYLDGVVREALRIKPIIGGSMRGTKSTIVVDGYQIPAGWGITYDRYNTHIMDPTTFQEDLSHMNVIQGFEPRRWQDSSSDGESFQRPGQDWIPFGVGPRYCLGVDLAMVEMKIFLAVLARKVPDLELVSPVVTDMERASDIRWREKSLIPVPEDGVQIRAIRPSKKKRSSRKDEAWTFDRIYKINKRLGCAD